jgi:hypothetical protein
MRFQVPEGCLVRFSHLRYSVPDVAEFKEKVAQIDPKDYPPAGIGLINPPRSVHVIREEGDKISPTGGITIVEVICEGTGHILMKGASRCHPLDPYNRKRGRDIALGRTLREYYELQRIKAQRAPGA